MKKKPNLCLIGVPKYDGENESKLENILHDIIRENFPSLARQFKFQIQEIELQKDIPQEEQPQGT